MLYTSHLDLLIINILILLLSLFPYILCVYIYMWVLFLNHWSFQCRLQISWYFTPKYFSIDLLSIMMFSQIITVTLSHSRNLMSIQTYCLIFSPYSFDWSIWCPLFFICILLFLYKLLENISSVLHVVQYILEPVFQQIVYISHSPTFILHLSLASLVAQLVKNPPAMQETRLWFLGWKDPLEKEMVTYSSILAWEIPWTEKPGGLQSMGSQESDTT